MGKVVITISASVTDPEEVEVSLAFDPPAVRGAETAVVRAAQAAFDAILGAAAERGPVEVTVPLEVKRAGK